MRLIRPYIDPMHHMTHVVTNLVRSSLGTYKFQRNSFRLILPSLHFRTSPPPSASEPCRPNRPSSTRRRRLRGPTTRICHSASKAQGSIPRITSALIPRSKSCDLRPGILTSCLCGVISIAHISKLVTDAVGDDVGIQRFLLA